MKRIVWYLLIAMTTSCWVSFFTPQIHAQIQNDKQALSDMELIERVASLQRDLQSPEIPKRAAAEKELIELGVRVLDYLEATTEKTPSDAVERTNRVRAALEKIAVAAVTQASRVSLKGKMSIAQVLKKIQIQTGNDASLPDETPDLFKDRQIEVEFENVKFWKAIDEVMQKGGLTIDTYGGEQGRLVLTPTQAARIAAANPEVDSPKDNQPDQAVPRNISGIFNFAVTQVTASRNLTNPALNYCNLQVLIRWEPRVTPISIALPASTIKAVDEFGNPIEISNQDAVLSGTVQPEIPELEFSIPIGLLDRQIEQIKSFDAQIDAVLPGRIETFKFKKLGDLESGARQSKAGATVTFEGIEKNEDLFGVTVSLSFDEEHNALESHQSWVYNNTVQLKNNKGKTFNALAYEGVRQTNNEVVIRYYFDQDPTNLGLHYTTPAAVVKVPVKISLKKIPLP